MKKHFKLGIALMVAAVVMCAMVPAMAAMPDKIALPDGILVEETMMNQKTVEFVGVVPDPKYKEEIGMMDGQSGNAIAKTTPTIREVILKDKDGNKETMVLGKEVKNFDQIKEGDIVTFTVSREVAIYLGKEGMVPGMGDSKLLFSAPKGSKPGAVEVKQSFVTLEILKLKPDTKEVTVRLPDGTIKTVVTPKLDFSTAKVGQNVIVRVTNEQSIVVAAPTK